MNNEILKECLDTKHVLSHLSINLTPSLLTTEH